MTYTTKVTWLGNCYGCRVLKDDKVILEGKCNSRLLIGATFRDLFRTLDKLGGDEFTAASHERKFKEGNIQVSAKHYWIKG